MQNIKRPRKKNWALIWIGLAVIVIGGTFELIRYRHEQAERQLAADRAAQIAAQAAQSKDYFAAHEQFKSGHFDPATIRQAVAAEFHRQALRRADDYFELKTPADRLAYLDKAIDDMAVYRAAMALMKPSTTRPSDNKAKAQLIAWAVAQPPDTRARLAEFKAALDGRCAQRGLPPMGAPPQ